VGEKLFILRFDGLQKSVYSFSCKGTRSEGENENVGS
jgi:hypothetical protein